jgi:hypothetical protein
MTKPLRSRLILLVTPLLALGAMALATPSASAVAIPAPPVVQAALQGCDAPPLAALTAWLDWAKGQPMTFTAQAVDGKYTCQIDAAGVSNCSIWNPKMSGKGWDFAERIYTMANHKKQVFTYHHAWVYNNYGANTNPLTNTKRYYPYDYWLPWTTAGVPVSTTTDADGWHVVTSHNLKPGDDQSEFTVVKVSPDGSRAVFIQRDKAGNVDVRTSITLRDVPTIVVPKATKQHL